MKKSIALVLVAIMILSIAAVAFAACNHSWYDAGTSKRIISVETIAKTSGCYYLSNPHTHKKTTYELTQRYVCKKAGCGAVKTVTTRDYEEKCPKH